MKPIALALVWLVLRDHLHRSTLMFFNAGWELVGTGQWPICQTNEPSMGAQTRALSYLNAAQ
jgi:hypothetical protein